jgi:signal transduction histidine kinase
MNPTQAAQDKGVICPELADLLEGYRDEIVASWVNLLLGMEDGHYMDHHWTHYHERPVEELQAGARQCISALAYLFRTGDYEKLADYSEHACQSHVGLGFDIAEVIEGHLLLDDAILPVVQRECQWDRYEDAALVMSVALDNALRWLVIRYAKLYSQALNARLEEQIQTLERQRLQLKKRVKEVTALVSSSALITSTFDLDRLLSLILEQLAGVIDYDRATVQMLIEGRLRVIAGRGFRDMERVLGAAFDPRENALAKRLLDSAEPIVLRNVSEEPAFMTDPDDPTRSWIGVPLRVRDETIGALALDKNEADFYTDDEGRTVLAFANQAAIAIENARLYDRAREQEVLAERNRLARELHDSLSQALFSMVLNAEAANLFFEADPAKAKAQISILYETANTALREMRTLIFELRPANLEQEGLAAVLTKHARMVGDRYGLKISVDMRGQRRLPLHIEKALFRVAQEALNNVVKHAEASEVTIMLGTYENWVKLLIEDNGKGIPEGAMRPNTLGLTSMRERVEQLGGTIEWTTGTGGKGTAVRVKVPCE